MDKENQSIPNSSLQFRTSVKAGWSAVFGSIISASPAECLASISVTLTNLYQPGWEKWVSCMLTWWCEKNWFYWTSAHKMWRNSVDSCFYYRNLILWKSGYSAAMTDCPLSPRSSVEQPSAKAWALDSYKTFELSGLFQLDESVL